MAERHFLKRREMLKASGLGLAVLAGDTGPVGAVDDEMTDEEAEEMLNRAQTILQKHGPETRAKYLRGRGIRSSYNRRNKSVGYTSDGNSSLKNSKCNRSNKHEKREIEVNIQIDYLKKLGYYYVSLQTRYKYKYWKGGWGKGYYYDMPQYPKDGLGLYWDNNKWELNTPEYPYESMFPPDYGSWDNGSWNPGRDGTGFRVDDKEVCIQSGTTQRHGNKEWSQWTRCGVQLAPGPEHTESSEVRGEYCHTWDAQNVPLGVTASYPSGVSISTPQDDSIKKRDISLDSNKNVLTVSVSDW